MGVRKFLDTFGKAGAVTKDITPLVAGKRVAIDMTLVLCKAIKAIHHGVQITDSRGIPTAGIKMLTSLIPRLQRAGARSIIAIFDNPAPNPMKAVECQRRRLCAEECKARAESADQPDERARLEHRAWQITGEVIADAMHLLTMLGIDYHIPPAGREAEQYAANLAASGVVDVVLSDDTDALMFGAPLVIMTRAPTGFIAFDLATILSGNGITMDQFRRICIALGTDFAEKISGVGPASALTRGKNKPLSETQARALEYISSSDLSAAIHPGNRDIAAAINWLVDIKGFNRARAEKALT